MSIYDEILCERSMYRALALEEDATYFDPPQIDEPEVRQIPGFSNYEIDSFGNIISYMKGYDRPRPIHPWMGQNGYLYVDLVDDQGTKRKFTLHRLLATVFIQNPEGLPHVRHYDDNHLNNDLSNLKWGTYQDNHDDMFRNGHEYHKEVYCYEQDRVYRSGAELARSLGCSKSAVTLACQGKNGSVCGFHVCFLEDKDDRLSNLDEWLKPYKYINKIHAQNLETGEELEFDNQTEAARTLGISNSGISQVLHGRIDKFHGWTFW